MGPRNDSGFELGAVIAGRYQIDIKLGEGGFSAVYRARQLATGQWVALKVLRQSRLHDEAGRSHDIARFQREMRLAGRLNHPNVIRLVDSGELDAEVMFSVFEYVEGRTLAQHLAAEGRMPVAEAKRLMLQVLDGLSCAHDIGMVHRDLKPQNIMITRTGARANVKLLDFGIAALMGGARGEDYATITQNGMAPVTPSYAAPEQLRGLALTPQTDIYAWGLVFIECLTGEPVIRASALADIVLAQIGPAPIPIPAALAGHPLGLLLRRATEKSLASRYHDVRQLFADLERCGVDRLPDRIDSAAATEVVADRGPLSDPDRTGKIAVAVAADDPTRIGHHAAQEGASPSPSLPERRQLTALSCAFTVSPADGAELDPEDLDEAQQQAREVAARVIRRAGGTLASARDDRLLAYFGVPVAHEDDARRAVRCGLLLVEETGRVVERLQRRGGLSVSVQVGIHTGLVVVKTPAAHAASAPDGQAEVVGAAPGIADRIQAEAAAGAVWISGATAGLIEGMFALDPLPPRVFKGSKAPTALFSVRRDTGARTSLEATSAPRSILLGRTQEVGLLLDRWQQVREGLGQAALISGEPGIGKSRLLHEIKLRLGDEPHLWLDCRCSPEHQDSPLQPLIELLERNLDLSRDDSASDKLAKLESLVEDQGLPRGEFVPHLASLLSLSYTERYPTIGLSPDARRRRLLAALSALLSAMAEREPLVLAVEDLHWADPSLIELLGQLVAECEASSMLLLLTARPTFMAPWSPSLQLKLNRLPASQVAELIDAVSAGRALARGVREQLIQRSDGVPLYAEELARVALEAGEQADDGAADETPPPMPMRLRDLLTARLDRIGPAKEVAQLAAAIGRELDYELLRAAWSSDEARLNDALARLVQADLLHRKGKAPRLRYVFKHSLIQDAAYDALVKSTRQQHHRAIARALKERFPEIVEKQPELLAHHCAQGALIEDALELIYRAGQRSLRRSANQEAMAHVRKGMQWLATGEFLTTRATREKRASHELRLQSVLIPALFATRGYGAPEAAEALQHAQTLIAEVGDTPHTFPVQWGMWVSCTVRGRHREAIAIARKLRTLADASGDPHLIIESHVAMGHSLYYVPDLDEGPKQFRRVLEMYELGVFRGHVVTYGQDPAILAYAFMSGMRWMSGYPEEGLSLLRAGRKLAGEIGHPFSANFIQGLYSVQRQLRGEPDEVFAAADELIQTATKHEHPFWLAIGDILQGWARVRRGDPSLEQVRSGIAKFRASGSQNNLPYYLMLLADAQAAVGSPREALATLDESAALIERTGERRLEAELHRLRGVFRLMVDPGDTAAVAGCFATAIAVAAGQRARSLELRAALELARLHRAGGRPGEARALLAPLYAQFTEGFDVADLIEAKRLLEEVA